MTETYFDTNLGELLVGEAAISERLEQSTPGTIAPLHTLLTASEFAYDRSSFPKCRSHEMGQEDYVQYGRWILGLLKESGTQKPTITQRILIRSYILGIGPEYQNIPTRFDSLTAYKQEVGADPGYISGKYAEWSPRTFMAHVRTVHEWLSEKGVNRVPTEEDLDAYSKDVGGPKAWMVMSTLGGTRQIREVFGKPNTSGWDRDNYLDWGVRIKRANNGRVLRMQMLDIIAARGKGPNSHTVATHSGSWPVYVNDVDTRYEATKARLCSSFRQKVSTYRNMLSGGYLPQEFTNLSDEVLIIRAAHYRLVQGLLPAGTDRSAYLRIVRYDPIHIVSAIQEYFPTMSAQNIESRAKALGVYDDLWMENTDNHLYVSPTEVMEYLDRKRNRKVA